jgi:tripartite-type tricarboxylate transporter receptor subunit TctC
MAKVVKQPDVQQRMAVQGFESVGSTADEFAKYIGTEMTKYGKIIKDANIKVD